MDYEKADNIFTQALKKEAQNFKSQENMESFWNSFEHKLAAKQTQNLMLKKRNTRFAIQMVAIFICAFLLFGAGATLTYIWTTDNPTTLNNGQQTIQPAQNGTEYIQIEPAAVPLTLGIQTNTGFWQSLFYIPGMIIIGIIIGIIFYHIAIQNKRKRTTRRVIKKIIAEAEENQE